MEALTRPEQQKRFKAKLTQLSSASQRIRAQISPGAAIGLILMLALISLVSVWNLTRAKPQNPYLYDTESSFSKAVTNLETTLEEPAGNAAPPAAGVDLPISKATSKNAETRITIYISGAVNVPGLYELAPQARVNDAVKAAKGLTAEADRNAINLATFLTDGDHVHIPTQTESGAAKPSGFQINNQSGVETKNGQGRPREENGTAPSLGSCIDIRTADETQLQTLAGIGPKTAANIVQYRGEVGLRVPEDLLQVRGIGMKTYQRLVPQLCP
ncbi:MAG: helix-hairpin-helix domain-containing protein [Actinomycetaceae bacterium]|nr:helix-hairpin-helix domain-containing protein [Actinomycetaceae bacterium]